jgi:hypothetical protein
VPGREMAKCTITVGKCHIHFSAIDRKAERKSVRIKAFQA